MPTFQVVKREVKGMRPQLLRKQGLIPMALVERTHETVAIQATLESFNEAIKHLDSHGRIELQIEGETGVRRAIIKEVDHDALRHQMLHVTLYEVADEDQIRVDVPVVAIGTAGGGDDATLTAVTTHVRLKGKMADMPSTLEVDVSELESGHHIDAGALKLPEGIELLSSPDATLFSLAVNKEPVLEPSIALEPAEPAEPTPEA